MSNPGVTQQILALSKPPLRSPDPHSASSELKVTQIGKFSGSQNQTIPCAPHGAFESKEAATMYPLFPPHALVTEPEMEAEKPQCPEGDGIS